MEKVLIFSESFYSLNHNQNILYSETCELNISWSHYMNLPDVSLPKSWPKNVRSAKDEYLRRIKTPLNVKEFRKCVENYIQWYNAFRPHQSLDGVIPVEIYYDNIHANQLPRFEPREKWPKTSRCAKPYVPLKERPGIKLKLNISYYQGDKLLPIISLKKVA